MIMDGNLQKMKIDYSISMTKANLYSIIFVLPVIFLGWIYYRIWGIEKIVETIQFIKTKYGVLFAVILLLLGIVIHELIHGYSWRAFSNKPKETIKFGINWKALSPYAHCTEPMNVVPYRLGCVMPAIVVGVLPYLAGLFSGNSALTLFGLFFIFAASGDFLILWSLRKVKHGNLVEDHPTNAGCFVYEKIGQSVD
jgi:hypothetical protein